MRKRRLRGGDPEAKGITRRAMKMETMRRTGII